eukprot:scaffold88840_cov29-Tisochrysis_lutea.AAC.4
MPIPSRCPPRFDAGAAQRASDTVNRSRCCKSTLRKAARGGSSPPLRSPSLGHVLRPIVDRAVPMAHPTLASSS